MNLKRNEKALPAHERIVSLRARLGWTTYRLALEAGVGLSNLYKIEQGTIGISKKMARKLADALGIRNPAALLDL